MDIKVKNDNKKDNKNSKYIDPVEEKYMEYVEYETYLEGGFLDTESMYW